MTEGERADDLDTLLGAGRISTLPRNPKYLVQGERETLNSSHGLRVRTHDNKFFQNGNRTDFGKHATSHHSTGDVPTPYGTDRDAPTEEKIDLMRRNDRLTDDSGSDTVVV